MTFYRAILVITVMNSTRRTRVRVQYRRVKIHFSANNARRDAVTV